MPALSQSLKKLAAVEIGVEAKGQDVLIQYPNSFSLKAILPQIKLEIGPLAAQVSDSGDVYFVPALTGLGTPYWDPDARGLLIGMTRGTTRQHIARAAEEAICFQTAAVLEAVVRTAGVGIDALRVDGGASRDDFLLQLQADLSGLPVVRPRILETPALGAAALAGLAVGYWSEAEVAALAGVGRVFEPRMSADERSTRRARWEQAVERARGWAV